VIAPAGKFDAIVTHFSDEWQEISEREIRPLAGEKCDGS
jgi:hypothetical protein